MLFIILAIIFVPLFCPYKYDEQLSLDNWDDTYNNLAPFAYSDTEKALIAAGKSVFPHIFGTDSLGRDYFIRVIIGTRVSLLVGFFAALIVLIIGSIYGAISGYKGGKVDMVMMRIVDVIYSLPDIMTTVGLSSEQATRYPHEFSGGQRQRIGIARALALNPELIVCDEPVSALDVSIQAQVLNTFEELQQKLKLTYLFVAHNLLVVKHISDRIAVMYLGHVVELADSDKLFEEPMHPYTVSLLSAIPVPDPKSARKNERVVLKGDIPSPLNAPSGCPFRTRCPFAKDACATEKGKPVLREVRKGHFVACLYPLQAGRTGM